MHRLKIIIGMFREMFATVGDPRNPVVSGPANEGPAKE
jgi:hypothetical protein